MNLDEMLIAVTESQPRGTISFQPYLVQHPDLIERIEELAHLVDVPPCKSVIAGIGWLVDALFNYGLPSDLDFLPRGGVE